MSLSGVLVMGATHQLVGERDLLELHLVDGGIGGAEQRSCGKQSSLHDGWLGCDGIFEKGRVVLLCEMGIDVVDGRRMEL